MTEKRINVGLIGSKFMGRAHSHALRNLHMFADNLGVEPVLKTICGRDAEGLKRMSEQFGWQDRETDWRLLVEDPQIDVIVILTPGCLHCPIAVAAAEKGKHVLCEKPLALSVNEAALMLEAVEHAGVKHMVNFNYRRVPAVAYANCLIEAGSLGRITHFTAIYQQDWPLDAEFPHIWRFDRAIAGAGSMADKGSHIIDLAHFLVGEIAVVAGATATFVPERPNNHGGKSPVTTDDAAVFVARFRNGALGLFETSRMSAGHKNSLRFEVNGSRGSLKFDLERLNELDVYLADDDVSLSGFRRVLVTESTHPYISHWWPPGHAIGWEHTFTHQYYEFFRAIADDTPASPSFADGLQCQRVIDAVGAANLSRCWLEV